MDALKKAGVFVAKNPADIGLMVQKPLCVQNGFK